MPFRHCLTIALLLILCAVPTRAPAVEDMAPRGPEISMTSLQAGKSAVEAAADLDDASRQHLLDLYEQAMTRYRETASARNRLAVLEDAVRGAPERIERSNERLFPLEADMSAMVDDLTSANLEELEAWLTAQRQALTHARDSLRQFEDELARLLAGSNNLSELISAHTATLEQYDREAALSIPGESELARQARLHHLEAGRTLHHAERAYYRKAAASQGVLIKLAQAGWPRPNASTGTPTSPRCAHVWTRSTAWRSNSAPRKHRQRSPRRSGCANAQPRYSPNCAASPNRIAAFAKNSSSWFAASRTSTRNCSGP